MQEEQETTGQEDEDEAEKLKQLIAAEKEAMIRTLRQYGILDERVLNAMAKINRHSFIPLPDFDLSTAYGDFPVPIGYNQTISQPYIVAYMTEKLGIKPGYRILEVGTGSGYQSAVLAELGADVYSVERIHDLAARARDKLSEQGYPQVHILAADGYSGWPEFAPYDGIVVTCAPNRIPEKLLEQLKDGGIMILPIGMLSQQLWIVRKQNGDVIREEDMPVRFVPMKPGSGLA